MTTSRRNKVRRVAVIGAGPGGLAAAKYLLAENAFERIDVFEQAHEVGGVWTYTPEFVKTLKAVPLVDPRVPPEDPLWQTHSSKEAIFPTAMYDSLETNIPNILMQYSDLPFPEDSQLFPKRQTVKSYLQDYAKDIIQLIRFQTQVLSVQPHGESGQWLLKARNLSSGSETETEDIYDGVVVANGHYSVPYLPAVKGITAWNEEYPGVISHSRFYRNPEPFKNKKVIIVGNSASGLDIGAQIGTVCKPKLIVSSQSASYLSPGPEQYKEEYPEIEEFISGRRAVRFRDGRVVEDIDAIVFCTGYLYSFPFLPGLTPPVVSDGSRTQHVYQHIFYNDRPTLAFIGLPQKIIPFPVSEGQAAVISRVWSGRLTLPDKSEMEQWEDAEVSDRGAGKAFHTLMFPLDADYLVSLHEWALEAQTKDGLQNNGRGKIPPTWGDRERWMRERFPAIKHAFAAKGEERHRIKTIEDLGYDYEAWRQENDEASKLL
ncbi:FAD/NAD(P)-binding domain-containing protein [Xylona heveae TC161]|uniref:FAD/NAD(P)-binding domain-containing protein n=1 Tax=Xylona heveae (strain CBS 132557 / TC161) TaxID=1328760 RepID=A0A165AE98_XYLHT|nr:FAD/NAD(P)-binding domain-containing protein [Xylona heveae TC161]KZF20334.1 FAD/NAD(P)-binding domain-containing protein [Xylona heveae TC161]